MDVLTNLIVVIILQCIYVLKHHTVYRKFIQCFMSIISEKIWEKWNLKKEAKKKILLIEKTFR